MLSSAAWEGVNSLIDNYWSVGKSDFVVIAYTSDTSEYCAWLTVALRRREVEVERVWMIPLVDSGFEQRFACVLPKPNEISGRLIVLTLERDTLSHEQNIRQLLKQYDQSRLEVYRVISTCEELFSLALNCAPKTLSGKNTTLLNRLAGSRNIRITTPGGSDLAITLDSKHRWISNRGVWREGNSVILPAGEVATFPNTIEGFFVADFAFNVNMISERDARLNKSPVKVWIRDGRATKYECDDQEVMSFLGECFDKFCAFNVGELGLGTNNSITKPVYLNSHINERHPGIHLGFGQSNQSPEIVGYDCDIHLDLIATGGEIWIDDEPSPIDLSDVEVSSEDHPAYTYSEDARAIRLEDLEIDDCCGLLTSDGVQLFSRDQSSAQ